MKGVYSVFCGPNDTLLEIFPLASTQLYLNNWKVLFGEKENKRANKKKKKRTKPKTTTTKKPTTQSTNKAKKNNQTNKAFQTTRNPTKGNKKTTHREGTVTLVYGVR